ncbi:MAG: hypothetical protein AAFP82_06800 [Bacteroidota bacterium]
MYRLEKHSGQLITALMWWQLFTRKLDHELVKDEKKRQAESERVRNGLTFRVA